MKYEANEGRTSCDIGTCHFPSPGNNRSSIQNLDSQVETRDSRAEVLLNCGQKIIINLILWVHSFSRRIPFDSGAPTFIF